MSLKLHEVRHAWYPECLSDMYISIERGHVVQLAALAMVFIHVRNHGLDAQIRMRCFFTHVLTAQPLVKIGTAVAWNAKHCNANATTLPT